MPRFAALLQSVVILCYLFLAGWAVYDIRYRPYRFIWLGFGVSYFSPVQASEFLKTHRCGTLLYNNYDSGGYLIHDLYPVYKVFVDPRFFPYINWYQDYLDFMYGAQTLESFNKKYPFDVAIVDYLSETAFGKFYHSSQWRAVFYGPVATVFVRSDVNCDHDFRKDDKHRFDDLRNLDQAHRVFLVAQNLGDIETSGHILQVIKKRFRHCVGYDKIVERISLMQYGLEEFENKHYSDALANLERVEGRVTVPVEHTLLSLRKWKTKELINRGKYQDAMVVLEKILSARPTYDEALYNAGIIAYQVEILRKEKKQGSALGSSLEGSLSLSKDLTNWRNYLKRFLELAPDHRHAWVARQLLEGKEPPSKVPLISW
jgi:tetratricopeptide (TPR) repeat protein